MSPPETQGYANIYSVPYWSEPRNDESNPSALPIMSFYNLNVSFCLLERIRPLLFRPWKEPDRLHCSYIACFSTLFTKCLWYQPISGRLGKTNSYANAIFGENGIVRVPLSSEKAIAFMDPLIEILAKSLPLATILSFHTLFLQDQCNKMCERRQVTASSHGGRLCNRWYKWESADDSVVSELQRSKMHFLFRFQHQIHANSKSPKLGRLIKGRDVKPCSDKLKLALNKRGIVFIQISSLMGCSFLFRFTVDLSSNLALKDQLKTMESRITTSQS